MCACMDVHHGFIWFHSFIKTSTGSKYITAIDLFCNSLYVRVASRCMIVYYTIII